ncbi:hypothetical protein CBR_g142 [Chara braunii]|uniref:Reverse transcriptase domain-containing protein n=1 Tax=Chara braunii TaxID=69332 RepID=A0A388JLZ8_CHABU|nr:hypothetical protein CBR_g142 [Chara braunii]|eukprot:GBG58742.1 hypothetical protein CBR_g142 [Chara braunii]
MIKDRVQKPLETVAEYRDRFYRMFVKTERGEQVGRDLFIDGLRSRTIRAKLRKQFPPINHTLQQIMAAAEEMERKFAVNFLEGEDYSREGDSSELWVRCPMAICNAFATFQRAMNMTFQNFINKTRLTQGMINFCVIVYMDDILVYSETYHGHAQHIEWTLGALRDTGFKIALEKSEFFLSEISFLGYVVTRGGLRSDSRKVAAVREAPVPTSLTQVRAFLGLASYYRRFIKGFAEIARPLTNLLRKDQPLSWDAECQQAFATLKDALATAPILIRPDLSKQFILITAIPPEIHSDIYRTLRTWAGEVRTTWLDLLARRGDTVVLAHDTDLQLRSAPLLSEEKWDAWWEDYIELAFCLLEIEFRWLEAAPFGEGPEHPEDSVELMIIQAWRTAEQGDLLGIIFGKVEEGNLTLITDELLVFLTQLVDDMPLDILSRSDKQPGTHLLSRTLEPHLVWSTCTEIDEDNCLYPSQALYLEIDVVDLTFWDPIARQNAAQDEEIGGADEEKEEVEPDEEEEEGNEQAESEYEGFEAKVRDAARERAQEQRKRKRQETTEGK